MHKFLYQLSGGLVVGLLLATAPASPSAGRALYNGAPNLRLLWRIR
jgi:hypothetical protein